MDQIREVNAGVLAQQGKEISSCRSSKKISNPNRCRAKEFGNFELDGS
jgi:hypothetical protein